MIDLSKIKPINNLSIDILRALGRLITDTNSLKVIINIKLISTLRLSTIPEHSD